jgi:Holliday junction resolvase RusA-like endonuclease
VRTFFVPGQPQGKGRARVVNVGGHARAFTPEKTANYESFIKLCYREKYAGEPLMTGELGMSIIATYAIPKSTSKRKAALMAGGDIRPTTKPDIDNVIKCISDSGNGVIYHDDTQIVKLHAVKRYGDAPGVEVTIIQHDKAKEADK